MNIYLLFFREKTKMIFNPEKSGLILLRLVLVLTSVFYGTIGSLLLNKTHLKSSASLSTVFTIIHFVIVLFILLRNILPLYSKRKIIIPNYFPVSKFKRVIINFIDVIYSPLTIYLLVFTLFLSLSPLYNLYEIGITYLVIFNSFLLELVLKKVLDEGYKNTTFYLFITLITIVFFGFVLVTYTLNSLLIFLLLFGVFFIFLNWYLEGRIIQKIASKNAHLKNTENSKLYTFTKLLFSRSSLKVSLLVAVVFKLLFLGSSILVYTKKGQFLFDSGLMFYAIISPLVHFTYIFNNYFGYTKELWLIFHLGQKRKELILSYFTPLVFILSIDFVVSMLAMSFMDKLNILFVLKYLFTAIVLTLNGLISSFLLPKNINSQFSFESSMQTNTSVIASIISIGFLGITLFFNSFLLQILIFSIIITIQAVILIRLNKQYSNVNYSFFKKIF